MGMEQMIFSDVLQFHYMSIFALPLGLNPDPGTMNFPILGEVYMDIMIIPCVYFFFKCILKQRRRFFKVLNTFRYLHYYVKYYTIRIGKQAKCLFEPSPSKHVHYMFILVPSNGLNLLFRDHNFSQFKQRASWSSCMESFFPT